MPDITLYKEDIEALRGLCVVLKTKIRRDTTDRTLPNGEIVRAKRVASDDELAMLAQCDDLSNLLLLRLLQGLHPKRKV